MHFQGSAVLVLLIIVAVVSGCTGTGDMASKTASIAYSGTGKSSSFGNTTGFVSRVMDGDTIRLRTGEKIRLLGIDSPERGQPHWLEARRLLKEMVENKTIVLERDVVDKDRYGRLLRYVYVAGKMVNEELVRKGLASVYIIKPNNMHEDSLRMAEAVARANEEGIWEPLCAENWVCEDWSECLPSGEIKRVCVDRNHCGTYQDRPKESAKCIYSGHETNGTETHSGHKEQEEHMQEAEPPCHECVNISEFHWNAEGNDNSNKSDEYVVFQNICKRACNLDGWNVSDRTGNTYTFAQFALSGSGKVALRSGSGEDTGDDLYWCNHGYRCTAIWNNKGDTLFLRDHEGQIVLEHSYP